METGIAGVPLKDVAGPLRDAWVRFHQSNLCLGIDTLFVFQPKGMEVWCRINDERAFQRFSTSLDPLRKNFLVELYPNRADREKKPYSPEDDDPPVSFWTNAELRTYMRDPFFSRIGMINDDESPTSAGADPELRRRLKLFGDEVMDQAGRLEHLAGDLPALAGAAFGEDIMPDIRAHAREACLGHAREAAKCAVKLVENLSRALPRSSLKSAQPQADPAQPSPLSNAYDGAITLSSQARGAARRVVLFLYPRAHTVDLSDLKKSSLIEALKGVQQAAEAFASSAQKAK